MSFLTEKPLGIVYNHTIEFNIIAQQLIKNGVPVSIIDPSSLALDAGTSEINFSLVFHDLSNPPGYPGSNKNISALINYARHLELNNLRFAQGRIINGSNALEILSNRFRQISLFSSLKIKYPRTLVANNLDALIAQINSLKFPIIAKGISNRGDQPVYLFKTVSTLIDALIDRKLKHVEDLILVQEYHEPKNDHIVRVDTLNGKVFSARKIKTLREPALSWDVELNSEPFQPGIEIVSAVEEIVRAGRVDLGSVEYFTDRKTNETYFYGISPYNYRKANDEDGSILQEVAQYFEKRLSKIREFELAL